MTEESAMLLTDAALALEVRLQASRAIVHRLADALTVLQDEARLNELASYLREFPNEPVLTIFTHCFPEIEEAIAAARPAREPVEVE